MEETEAIYTRNQRRSLIFGFHGSASPKASKASSTTKPAARNLHTYNTTTSHYMNQNQQQHWYTRTQRGKKTQISKEEEDKYTKQSDSEKKRAPEFTSLDFWLHSCIQIVFGATPTEKRGMETKKRNKNDESPPSNSVNSTMPDLGSFILQRSNDLSTAIAKRVSSFRKSMEEIGGDRKKLPVMRER
ncbi:unnamed protein product [Vicia faba]|uniref:Uncharacterized protein n=1 Tax=Vicia faba TaxID=3906 RepID=A0AAV0ZZY4_VICFA|nr:unnamed protein product [Vicia faba]